MSENPSKSAVGHGSKLGSWSFFSCHHSPELWCPAACKLLFLLTWHVCQPLFEESCIVNQFHVQLYVVHCVCRSPSSLSSMERMKSRRLWHAMSCTSVLTMAWGSSLLLCRTCRKSSFKDSLGELPMHRLQRVSLLSHPRYVRMYAREEAAINTNNSTIYVGQLRWPSG